MAGNESRHEHAADRWWRPMRDHGPLLRVPGLRCRLICLRCGKVGLTSALRADNCPGDQNWPRAAKALLRAGTLDCGLARARPEQRDLAIKQGWQQVRVGALPAPAPTDLPDDSSVPPPPPPVAARRQRLGAQVWHAVPAPAKRRAEGPPNGGARVARPRMCGTKRAAADSVDTLSPAIGARPKSARRSVVDMLGATPTPSSTGGSGRQAEPSPAMAMAAPSSGAAAEPLQGQAPVRHKTS